MKKIWRFLWLIILILSSCARLDAEQSSEFFTPESETYVNLLPIVQEYFYFRKRAVLNGNMPDFYVRYPDLANNSDLEQGINVEGLHVENMGGLAVFDGNIFPEYYEKMGIKKDGDEIQILLHGKEMYLRADSKRKLNETGGEFKMVLFLRKEGSGWQIYKTDEVTLREWKEERSGMN